MSRGPSVLLLRSRPSRALRGLVVAALAGCGQGPGAAVSPAIDSGAGGGTATSADGSFADGSREDGSGGTAPEGGSPGEDGGDDAAKPSGILVGYYAYWSAASLPVTSIDWASVTHVAHAFALPKSGGGLSNGTTLPNDALVQAAHAHGVKVVVSVGGASGDFSAVVGTAGRAATVSALVAFCSQHAYDGIDVDWEFPDATTISAWVTFMGELRTALDAVSPGLSLSSTIDRDAANGDILPAASLAKLSWVGAMTYRYTGPKDAVAGFYAPLNAPPGAEDGSVSASIQHLVGRGVPASKLVLGIGLYGEQFADGPAGTAISAPSTVTPIFQSSIVPLVGQAGWTLSWDATASESSLLNGKTWITFEDARSIDVKCGFVHSSGLAGALTWHMALGVLADGSQPLLGRAAGCR